MPRKKHPLSTNRGVDKDRLNENYNAMMIPLMQGKTLSEVWGEAVQSMRDLDKEKGGMARPFDDLRKTYHLVVKDYIAMLQPQKKQQLWDEETGEMILWKH